MEFKDLDNSHEPFSFTMKPSIEGGKFIVNDSDYLDGFVGNEAVIFGVSQEDIDKLLLGDTSPISNYLRPVDEIPGTVKVSESVIDVEVVANRNRDRRIFTGVKSFQEVAPYPII